MYEDQQLCLKWNNHRKTLFTVFDNLLEEESLVDVALMADGQIIKAHRVILSACSPYFKAMLKEPLVGDKLPIFILKDVDIENLRSLIEYMYKGEVYVQQSMFSAFIKAAESLQIRGLAEKQAGSDSRRESRSLPSASQSQSGFKDGIKQRGLQITDSSGNGHGNRNGTGESVASAQSHFPFSHDNPIQRHPNPGPPSTPTGKKSRKSEPRQAPPAGFSPHGLKDLIACMPPATMKNLAAGNSRLSNNNNNDNDNNCDDRQTKKDDDIDSGKENRLETTASHTNNDNNNASNGMTSEDEEEEEEMSMPGPHVNIGEAARIINPWTGEQMKFNEEQEFGSIQEDTGMVGWPNTLGDISEAGHSPGPHLSSTPPHPAMNASSPDFGQRSQRLKRLNSAQQHSVYSMCQTPEGVKYRCLACNRCFNLKCTLLRHVRHQHQGRFVPHPCEQCGQVFKRTDHLKVHMKKIHNVSPLVKPKA